MPIELLSENIDLAHMPSPTPLPEGVEITIGDLHANSLKLLYLLVRHHIISISPTDYYNLVNIYNLSLDNLKNLHIEQYNHIIDHLPITNRDLLLRLLGDEMGDRGSNDYFTLYLLHKLKQEKIPLEILLSNHNLGFIEAYELNKRFEYEALGPNQARSLYAMQKIIDTNMVSKETILNMIEQSYKPSLKPIGFSLPYNDTILIYSHAPIDVHVIEQLAVKLNIAYQDHTLSKFTETINRVRKKFSSLCQENLLHSLYNSPTIGVDPYLSPAYKNPIDSLTWNRNYLALKRNAAPWGNAYQILYAHGHDSSCSTRGNVYNLDNTLGKIPGTTKGVYTMLLVNKSKNG